MSGGFLSVEGVTRQFVGLVAVDDVSFDVAEGEIVSVIGPNGAGKTTLFNLLTGQLKPNERRRLEVARAMATDPSLILLDEVMAGLNSSEVSGVIELVEQLNARGITFLIIEHNLKVVRAFSKRVIVLDHGVLIAEGTADDILSSPQVIEAYVGRRK